MSAEATHRVHDAAPAASSSRLAQLLAFLDRHILALSVAAVVGLLAVTSSGATVRLTASGLGCESWPGCQGRVHLPAHGYHSYIEFGNRVVSSVPIVLTILLAIVGWRRRTLPVWTRRAAVGTGVATLGQAPLGALTVYSGLHPLMVMTHFLFTFVAIALAVVVAVEIAGEVRGRGEPVERRLRLVALGLGGLLVALVLTGALTTAAGPHPGDYTRNVRRVWDLNDAAWLHVRVTAAFGLTLIGFVVLLLRRRHERPRLARYGVATLLVVCVQAGIGELQWRTGLPWKTVLAHVSVAGIAWASVVALVTLCWRPTETVSPTPRRLRR